MCRCEGDLPMITDLLIGVNMTKYRKRISRVHKPAMSVIQLLALEIFVRESLKKSGVDPDSVDVDGAFMDNVDPSLTYGENKALIEARLLGCDRD